MPLASSGEQGMNADNAACQHDDVIETLTDFVQDYLAMGKEMRKEATCPKCGRVLYAEVARWPDGEMRGRVSIHPLLEQDLLMDE
jgi:hypothetical protein